MLGACIQSVLLSCGVYHRRQSAIRGFSPWPGLEQSTLAASSAVRPRRSALGYRGGRGSATIQAVSPVIPILLLLDRGRKGFLPCCITFYHRRHRLHEEQQYEQCVFLLSQVRSDPRRHTMSSVHTADIIDISLLLGHGNNIIIPVDSTIVQ